jgi:diadenosine tetraphosphate (Ap4A) HIT family hydrolase
MIRRMEECLICNRISMIKDGTNPYSVAELETGYVVIGDHQYFKGYSLFLSKEHAPELHSLQEEYKAKFLLEMSWVAEAVQKAFKADKMNYELLGNGDAHLHWHLFPRRFNEENPTYPVWWTDSKIMYAEEVKPSIEELEHMRKELYMELMNVVGDRVKFL